MAASGKSDGEVGPQDTMMSSAGTLGSISEEEEDTVRFRQCDVRNGAVREEEDQHDDPSKIIRRASSEISGRHHLESTERGESSIERLYLKMKTRRDNRIPVTFDIRKQFLTICRDLARQRGQMGYRLHISDLIELRNSYRMRVEERPESTSFFHSLLQYLGWWDYDAALLELFDAGIEHVERIGAQWFHYRDFNFYDTVVVPKRRFLTNPTSMAIIYLFVFYFATAVFFCNVLDDSGVCPADPDGNKPYFGWVSAIYFASVTMSTVGYGDLSVNGDSDFRLFIGAVYMVLALLVGFTVFSTAAEAAISTLSFGEKIVKYANRVYNKLIHGGDEECRLLYQIIRRLKVLRITKLVSLFLLYNAAGMLIARFFVYDIKGDDKWTWMTTFYWAVQTTTTVGYGDLSMPFNLRWFQIFFTTFGTVLVGSVFGELSNLKNELQDTRRFYAWKRRKVSKRLIEDMKGSGSQNTSFDAQIDQYEFMVGSLLMLNKISQNDVEQIMDKFRELAGDKGCIMYTEALQEDISAPDTSADNTASETDQDDQDNLDVDVDCPAA